MIIKKQSHYSSTTKLTSYESYRLKIEKHVSFIGAWHIVEKVNWAQDKNAIGSDYWENDAWWEKSAINIKDKCEIVFR